MKNRALGLMLGSLLGAAALMGGCASSVASVPESVPSQTVSAAFASPSPSATASTASTTVPSVAVAVSPAAVSYEDAIQVILEQLPNSVPTSCSLDTVSHQMVWDIDVLTSNGTEYETAVDAASGTLVYARPDEDRPDITASDIVISYTEAVGIAQSLYPDCYFESFSVDRENGTVVYEVEMRNAQGRDREVVLDAQTAEVLLYSSGAIMVPASVEQPYGDNLADPYEYDNSYAATSGSVATATAAPAASGAGWHHAVHGHHS